jgi:hypothetical protein
MHNSAAEPVTNVRRVSFFIFPAPGVFWYFACPAASAQLTAGLVKSYHDEVIQANVR